jgi:tetratricopeptide (TPR) repeat protein
VLLLGEVALMKNKIVIGFWAAIIVLLSLTSVDAMLERKCSLLDRSSVLVMAEQKFSISLLDLPDLAPLLRMSSPILQPDSHLGSTAPLHFMLRTPMNLILFENQMRVLIHAYSLIIKKDPQNASAYFQRANVYQELKEWGLAIGDYSQAILLNGNYTAAYHNRGFVHQTLGQYDKAIEDYGEAIRTDPQHMISYNNRGNVYKEIGALSHAIDDYSRAIQLNPDTDGVYFNRGIAYHILGHYQSAIADYSMEIHRNPADAESYNNRGNAYQKLGMLQQAKTDYQKVVEIDPQAAYAYFNMGITERFIGNIDQAIKDYDKAIELNPDYADAYILRADIYFLKHQYEKSLQDVIHAKRLGFDVDPGFIEKIRNALHQSRTTFSLQ